MISRIVAGEINKLEQEQNELFTPQDVTLQKEKNRKLLRGIVDGLRLVRDYRDPWG